MVVKKNKKNYLAAIVVANLCFLVFCLHNTTWQQQDNFQIKTAAADTAAKAREIIGPELIGEEYTPLTTTLGPAEAKRLSIHPDFAAVAVELLLSAGVKEGDIVAVNLSGSFPALNIAVLSGIKAIGCQAVVTSSVGASTWGANRPELTWLDMERMLAAAGMWTWRSRAASVGGVGDNGGGLSEEGLELAKKAIARSGVPEMTPANISEAVQWRLDTYKGAAGKLPAALVNVGGSHVIFGELGHRVFLRQGLLYGYKDFLGTGNGLAASFLQANRPVIHFLNIAGLGAEYGIYSHTPPGYSRAFYVQTAPMAIKAIISVWVALTGVLLWHGKSKGWI